MLYSPPRQLGLSALSLDALKPKERDSSRPCRNERDAALFIDTEYQVGSTTMLPEPPV